MRAGNGDVAERVFRLHSHDTNQLLLKYEATLGTTTRTGFDSSAFRPLS
jgi:hypothetical protein